MSFTRFESTLRSTTRTSAVLVLGKPANELCCPEQVSVEQMAGSTAVPALRVRTLQTSVSSVAPAALLPSRSTRAGALAWLASGGNPGENRMKGGRLAIAPILEGARTPQLYLPDANVLRTRFLDDAGVAEILDFMPVAESGTQHNLVRQVHAVRGELRFRMLCAPRLLRARGHRVGRRKGKV